MVLYGFVYFLFSDTKMEVKKYQCVYFTKEGVYSAIKEGVSK
jgi:hypothetical protein